MTLQHLPTLALMFQILQRILVVYNGLPFAKGYMKRLSYAKDMHFSIQIFNRISILDKALRFRDLSGKNFVNFAYY